MILKTERLILRPMAENDTAALADILSDGKVGETYMVPSFATRADALRLAARCIALSVGDARFVRGIYIGEALIGMINETERGEDFVEFGYVISPAHWNRGYATEAFSAVMEAFLLKGFKVVAGAFESNTASIRVMQKSGMRLSSSRATVEYRGTLRRCVYYEAKPGDVPPCS